MEDGKMRELKRIKDAIKKEINQIDNIDDLFVLYFYLAEENKKRRERH